MQKQTYVADQRLTFFLPYINRSSYENNLNEDIEELIKEWSIPSKDIRFDTLLRQSRKGEIYK